MFIILPLAREIYPPFFFPLSKCGFHLEREELWLHVIKKSEKIRGEDVEKYGVFDN